MCKLTNRIAMRPLWRPQFQTQRCFSIHLPLQRVSARTGLLQRFTCSLVTRLVVLRLQHRCHFKRWIECIELKWLQRTVLHIGMPILGLYTILCTCQTTCSFLSSVTVALALLIVCSRFRYKWKLRELFRPPVICAQRRDRGLATAWWTLFSAVFFLQNNLPLF